MKRIDCDGFIEFIEKLEDNEPKELISVDFEGNKDEFLFMKVPFAGWFVVLYENGYGAVGIIQDTPAAPFEDYAESVFDDLLREGECELFVK